MKKILLAVIISMLITISNSNAENSMHRKSKGKPRNEKVKLALASFVHGMQYGLPGVVRSIYQVETENISLKGSLESSTRNEKIRNFMTEFSGLKGKPAVCLVDYEIRWTKNGRAIVNCKLAWHLSDSHNRKVVFSTRDIFEFVDLKGKYVINKAETTPIVINHLSEPSIFKEKIRKAKNKIRRNYEFKIESKE